MEKGFLEPDYRRKDGAAGVSYLILKSMMWLLCMVSVVALAVLYIQVIQHNYELETRLDKETNVRAEMASRINSLESIRVRVSTLYYHYLSLLKD